MARTQDFGEKLKRALIEAAKQQLRARFSSIRHPQTGEFPTVLVEGSELQDLRVRIEGSPALLALIKEKLSPQDLEGIAMETPQPAEPKVFLSFGGSDRALAEKIAKKLQANGVDTWWAEWEIGPGDSIPQKINEGLDQCTHFIVLLTPASISRPWVQVEIDAGFVRMVDTRCKLIVLRHGLTVNDLPPLLQGRMSPEINGDVLDLTQLIHFIHGVSSKPPLGPKPAAVVTTPTGYSAAASKVAELFCRKSRNGMFLDPQYRLDTLVAETGLTENDVKDALHELSHYIANTRSHIAPENCFFPEFDKAFMGWDPAADALRLAADIANDKAFPASPKDIDAIYGWGARRFNPAITFLRERNLVMVTSTFGCAPYIAHQVLGTDNTRRFVASRT